MPFAKGNARDTGKPGLRGKGRQSPSKLSLRELARMLIMDPLVQKQILKQARAGTLPPRVLIELVHYVVGPPPSEPAPPPPSDRERAQKSMAEGFKRLTRQEQQQFWDLLRKMESRDPQANPPPEP